MSFLGLEDKTILVFGVANKKSVAFHVGRVLRECGARPVYVVHTEARREALCDRLDGAPIYVCDVEEEGALSRLAAEVSPHHPIIHGMVHSIAYANYREGETAFEEIGRRDFLQAVQISCHSLMEAARAFRPYLDARASVVTISISTTRMAAENYGYMAPVKAALDSAVVFLAKSFSRFSEVRFNSVCPGLLKTNSSAGIPGYVDSYLFAEKATLRKRGVMTEEVANTVVFLLSQRAQGINAQRIVIDAGMGTNYFDPAIVRPVVEQ